jgi:hypothetical protein
MYLILTIVVFITVVLVVFAFGAAAVTPSSVLGARLRALGSQATIAQENLRLESKTASNRHSILSARPSRFRPRTFPVLASGSSRPDFANLAMSATTLALAWPSHSSVSSAS